MKTYFKTEHSSLVAYPIDVDIEACVSDVAEQLVPNLPVIVYGRAGHQHRSLGLFSDEVKSMAYTGQRIAANPLTLNLRGLLEKVNIITGEKFNSILVNGYMSGADYLGKHSDYTRVATVSAGVSRKFRIRDKQTNRIVADIPTAAGEIWVMCGRFQEEFTHEIPPEKKVVGTRYSFTFRRLN